MTSMRPPLWALAVLFLANPAWTHAQPPPSANELVVEASRLIRAAESAPTPEQTISLLGAAYRKFVLITEVHPASDLAVKLATGQGIGTVSLASVQAAIKAATERCWTSLSLICVARLTLDAWMSSEDKDKGVSALIPVASAQMKGGASEDAQATFKLATDVALSDEYDFQRLYYLSAIATAQAEAGQFSVALTTVELIDRGKRSKALSNIATLQAEAGQFSAALTTAERIERAYDRIEAFLNIAAAQRRVGKAEEARLLMDKSVAAAVTVDHSFLQVRRLTDVATAQAEAGNIEAARTTIKHAAGTARSLQEPDERASAFSRVAGSYIDIGDEESARATIDQAVAALQSAPQSEGGSELVVVALAAIARAQTKAGQSEAVRLTVDAAINRLKAAKAYDASVFMDFLIIVRTIPLEADQLAEVIPSFENFGVYALAQLAKALARAGPVSNVTEALKVLRAVIADGDRAHIAAMIGPFAELALAQAQDGQVEAARATIGLVTEAVKASGGNANATYIFDLAQAQAQAGLVGDAKSTLRDVLQEVQAGRYQTPYGPLSGILEVLLKMHDAARL